MITFIGAGNMARSLVEGLIAKGTAASTLRVADPIEAQRAHYVALGVEAFADNAAAVDGATTVVLAVKPQLAAQVLGPLSLAPEQLLLSIAAGITSHALAAWTQPDQAIIRCMPNTPALVGSGAAGLYASTACSAAHRQAAEQILNAVGTVTWVAEETQLDAVTAVSGSGPAYFFQLMESMIDAGTKLGLSPEVARQLTVQTALGAARMAAETNDEPAQLRQNVTSPGGTTAAALEVMHSRQLPSIIEAALTAADHRAAELGREFGN